MCWFLIDTFQDKFKFCFMITRLKVFRGIWSVRKIEILWLSPAWSVTTIETIWRSTFPLSIHCFCHVFHCFSNEFHCFSLVWTACPLFFPCLSWHRSRVSYGSQQKKTMYNYMRFCQISKSFWEKGAWSTNLGASGCFFWFLGDCLEASCDFDTWQELAEVASWIFFISWSLMNIF